VHGLPHLGKAELLTLSDALCHHSDDFDEDINNVDLGVTAGDQKMLLLISLDANDHE